MRIAAVPPLAPGSLAPAHSHDTPAVDRFQAALVLFATISHQRLEGSRVHMSRLDRATERLNAALDRLERAAAARAERAGAGAGPAGGDDAALRAEIESLRAENRSLRQANADAGRRLDTAIERLHGVLEA